MAELPAETAFFGVGDVGGQLASQILRRLAPMTPGIIEHGVRGGVVGATGMAAAIPLYPEDQRPSMQELATTAGSLALFSALTGALGGRAGLLRPAMETHRRFREAWAGGDMETARAEYDRFWQDVNAAYAAARTAPGEARRPEIPEGTRVFATERARLRTPALPEPRQKARLEAIEARRPAPAETPPMEGYEPLSEKFLPPQWQELLARARERMAAQPPRFTVKTRAAAGLWGRPEPPRPKPEPLHEQWLRILRERLAASEDQRATRSGGTVETVQGPMRPETPVRPSRVIEAPPLPTVRAPERQAETASAELLRQLERYGTARLNGTTAKIVQHPSGEGFAVEVTVSGQRNLIPSDPLTIEAARKEAVKALLAEATTPQVRSEQERPTVPLVVFGPKGERLIIIDDTDPAKLKVRNELGTEFWIGRKAVKAEPPAAQKAKREAIERGMEPVVQRWNGMSYDDRFNVAQTVGWNKRDSDKFAKSEWSKLSPAAQRVLQRYFASKQGKPPETPKATEASKPAAPGQIQGKTATAKTERGTAVETRYAVVDANDLIASHDTALRTDKRYPAELQPRDRSRAASKEQIGLIVNKLEPEFLGESPKASEGAPIVGPDLVVESGNGRVIALKTAYESGHENAGKYRQWLLDNAERFGLDKKALEGVERPVLVRVRQTDVDRVQFTREANEQAVAAMSATEQAMADGKKLSGALLDEFVPGENGEIVHRANWDFVRRFFQEVVGPAERGRYMTADGGISQEGVNRIRNAVFAKAYGDPAVLAKLAESTDSNVRNITNAMLIAAPRLAKVKDGIANGTLHDLDLTQEIAAAANKLSYLRETGMSVEKYLNQTTMFGEDISPLAKDILGVFDQFGRSAKKLSSILNAYADVVEAVGHPKQESFFGKIIPTKAEVLEQAIRKVVGTNEESLQASLFQNQAVRRGDAGQAAPRVGEGAKPEAGGGRQGGSEDVKGMPGRQRAVVVRSADDVRQALAGSADEITIASDARIPKSLAARLGDMIQGWDLTRNEDGSVTFRKGREEAVVREAINDLYKRVGVREENQREEAAALAYQAVSESTAAGRVPAGRGTAVSSGGVRTLGVAISRDFIQDGRVSFQGKRIQNAEDLAVLAQVLRDPRFETFRVFYVRNGRIIGHEALTSRLPHLAVVLSDNHVRDAYQIRQRIRRLKADGYYLLHNHPSGDPKPSGADRQFTKYYAELVDPERFRGHVVIDSNKYALINSNGDFSTRDLPQPSLDFLYTPELDHPALGKVITGPAGVAEVGASLRTPENFVSIIYMDAKNRVRAVQEIPIGLFRRPKEAADFIRGQARAFGSPMVLAYYRGAADLREASQELVMNAALRDVVLYDGHGESHTSVRRVLESNNPFASVALARREAGTFIGREISTQDRYRVRESEDRYADDELVGVEYFVQQAAAKAQAQTKTSTGGKPVGRVDIIRYIEDKLLAPVREKRMTLTGARAQYNTKTEVIRTKQPEDLEAIAHEAGHHLTKTLKLDFMKYPELQPLGARLYPQAGAKLQHEEGLAEFFRFYFVRPEIAKQAAPTFFRDFESRLEAEPKLKGVIREVQRLYQAWYGQDAVDHIKGIIVRDQPKDRPFLKTTEKVYADWVDDLYPLYKAVKTALGGKADPEKDLPILADPYRLARLARGRARKAVGMLERATVSPDLKIIGPGLREILKPVRNQIEDFTAYITARRAMELFHRGIESGADPLKAAMAIERLDSPAFRKAHDQLMKYQDNLIDHLVDAGIVARETAETMRDLNRNYVPFYRYFGEEVASKGLVIGSRKRWTDLPKPVKGIKGSQRSIIDPLESIVRNTIWLVDIAERNRVARALADIADKAEGMGWLMERVPTPVEPSRTDLERLEKELQRAGVPDEILDQIDFEKLAVTFNPVGYARIKEKKENILTVYRNGKPTFYQVHPELYRALEMLDAPSANWFIRLLAFPARMLRAGAVLTPEFIARNPARDQLSAWAFSKYQFFPVVDLLRGLFHVAKRDDLYKLWEASGGAQAALVSLDRDYLQTNLRQLIGKQTAKERLRRAAVSPLTFLQTVSEAVEEATRVGEFARGLKREGTSREAKARAAYSSREVTVDFSRAGYKGRQANEMVAFFNAAVQGTNRLVRAWREDPIGFTLKGVTFITIPSIILYLMNRDDPRYKELPRWRRDLYWCIPGEGDTLYFVPKPFELGIVFGTAPERVLEYIDGQDPKVLKDLAVSAKEAGTPSVLPTALIPLAEAYANRSLFTGAPIVPMREQRLEPSEQYGPYTTGVARSIGKAFNISPRKFEAMVRGYTGGLGMHALHLIDALTGNRAPGAELTEVAPVLKAYTGKAYRSAESIDVFYDELQRLERAYSTAQEQKKKGQKPTVTVDMDRLRRLRRVEELLNKRRQKIRKIQETKALTPDEKLRQIDKLNVEMVNLARIALGKRPVSGAGGS
ncbi:MAG: LPD38 domain-containing protein [Bacillota bacterium]